MEYNDIINLMQEMTKIGITKVKIEQRDFKLEIERGPQGIQHIQPKYLEQTDQAVQETPEPPKNEDVPKKEIPGVKKILSPMVGTFYAQPAPDKPPYVSVGDVVKKGQPVCIIEAMKLMNEIESEVEGEIIECLVENEDMVEFGQPLFLVK
ncbi:MAG: acetyl-CoA carboxylase biotin carboxyl carrier protein [Clostridiales bacterium]|jgi:acetyl-CoA carboxylase biotin carboxyl carrier protein|nr:acetyl-CoA carboxylase biotin carboxyl carrier protein [Clostridiales bacterium]